MISSKFHGFSFLIHEIKMGLLRGQKALASIKCEKWGMEPLSEIQVLPLFLYLKGFAGIICVNISGGIVEGACVNQALAKTVAAQCSERKWKPKVQLKQARKEGRKKSSLHVQS
jgi:hypothetical protein